MDDLVAVDEVEIIVREWQLIDVGMYEMNVLELAEADRVLQSMPGCVNAKNERVTACMGCEVCGISSCAGACIEDALFPVEQLGQAVR